MWGWGTPLGNPARWDVMAQSPRVIATLTSVIATLTFVIATPPRVKAAQRDGMTQLPRVTETRPHGIAALTHGIAPLTCGTPALTRSGPRHPSAPGCLSPPFQISR